MKKKIIAIVLIIIAIIGIAVYNVQKNIKEKGKDYTIEEIKEKDNENLTAIIQQFISEVNVLRNEIKQLKDDQAKENK